MKVIGDPVVVAVVGFQFQQTVDIIDGSFCSFQRFFWRAVLPQIVEVAGMRNHQLSQCGNVAWVDGQQFVQDRTGLGLDLQRVLKIQCPGLMQCELVQSFSKFSQGDQIIGLTLGQGAGQRDRSIVGLLRVFAGTLK